MSTQPKPLEHRSEQKVGDVQIKRDSASGRFVTSRSQGKDAAPEYDADAVAQVKALAKAPSIGEPMDADDYLRWLNG